ncbi:MAG: beta-propeller fold lactonase family protein [Planctomycetota bacterium]
MKAETTYVAALGALAGGCLVAVTFAHGPVKQTPFRVDHALSIPVALSPSTSAVPDTAHTNWEVPHVHPIDLTPDGQTLLAVNTADAKLEVFDVSSGLPRHVESIPVGLAPVSVRARTNTEAWVVNHVSDTVSVIDLNSGFVTDTIATDDEPADVVFAGTPRRSFVSNAQDNTVQVFDLTDTSSPISTIDLVAEDPRALAVSPDGQSVHVAIFEGGNRTTVLGGGAVDQSTIGFPPNVVGSFLGPYGGQNPPPNNGAEFHPPLNPELIGQQAPIRVSLIVKQDQGGAWRDDNGTDWTNLISGPQAFASGRLQGWTLVDHDVATIDTDTLSVSYASDINNLNMAIGVHPVTGEVFTVGTDAINEVRFEPILNSRFLRVNVGIFTPGSDASVTDLNPHLLPHYTDDVPFVPIEQSERDKSIGDPRAVVVASNDLAYVAGMGSNNIVVIDPTGARAGLSDTIEVGQGPTGLALNESAGRLYVLNKFDASITTIDTASETAINTTPFFDPTPQAIKNGRPFLYDTHLTSGTGHVSCASCHVDGRTDGLPWDLGDPAGEMKTFNQNCIDEILGGNCRDWHPMKGPMTTQTLVDIIGKEPHHWRGDREGIEAFNGAFLSILGDDQPLAAQEMQAFEDMLASLHFAPNPNRNLDNTLPTSLDLEGHYTIGRFAPAGQPLPDGNAVRALGAYRTQGLDAGIQCVTCHTLDTGSGPDGMITFAGLQPLPPGPMGERHLGINSIDGFSNVSMKIPQLRNLHEKTGFNLTKLVNTRGSGYAHDGSIDSIERFVGEPAFSLNSVQALADMTAFMLAFAGGNLPQGSMNSFFEPLGPEGRDTHAGVGTQVTLIGAITPTPDDQLFDQLVQIATASTDLELIAKGDVNAELRGYLFEGPAWQSDRAAESFTTDQLRALATPDAPIVVTAVTPAAARRLGIDRDLDTFFDTDESDVCADPADALSTPANATCCPADLVPPFGITDLSDLDAFIVAFLAGDPIADLVDPVGIVDLSDLDAFIVSFLNGCP